ncbi:MAG: hypothetical protein AAF763_10525, partial [Pseudomonadota bacterium]
PLIDVEKSWRSRQLGLPPLLHSNESWPQRSGEVDRGAQLREHLKTFLDAYNFAKRLKTLKGLTVFEFISAKWASEQERFRLHPDHLIPGPNI